MAPSSFPPAPKHSVLHKCTYSALHKYGLPISLGRSHTHTPHMLLQTLGHTTQSALPESLRDWERDVPASL